MGITGKLLGFILGLVVVVFGVICCISIVGIFAGIPFILIGISMMLSALF